MTFCLTGMVEPAFRTYGLLFCKKNCSESHNMVIVVLFSTQDVGKLPQTIQCWYTRIGALVPWYMCT